MQKINFQNLPNTTTPVNATNLNQVQTNVENEINGLSDIYFDKTKRLTISNSSDLNTLVETNIYSCGGATPLNSPNNASWGGMLLVLKSYYIFQIIFNQAAAIWYRYQNENNTWSSWSRMN